MGERPLQAELAHASRLALRASLPSRTLHGLRPEIGVTELLPFPAEVVDETPSHALQSSSFSIACKKAAGVKILA